MEVVLDASVVVKWFVEEDGSDKALALRDRYVDGELRIIAPELLVFEALNALRYKGLFSREELAGAAEALEAFSFTLYPLRDDYARRTIDVAAENNITIYDASYVALALMRNAAMYTADEKLVAQLREKYSSYVRNIREI